MDRSRSLDTCRTRKKWERRKLEPESLKELKRSYAEFAQQKRVVGPWVFDERKNLVCAKSFGHVNHPANVGSGWRWATLVDRLLEASVYGLRQPLEIKFDVYSYASPVTV
jgi:hypothetical protein